MKILIIDDNELLRRAAARCLQMRGHEVLVADNGTEGLALALSSKPDRIICDYDMPGLDGVQVYDRLPAHQQERFYIWSGSFEVPFPHKERLIEKPCNVFEMLDRAGIS